jgi:hypothetical protein
MPRMGQPTLLRICGRTTEVVSRFVHFQVVSVAGERPGAPPFCRCWFARGARPIYGYLALEIVRELRCKTDSLSLLFLRLAL